MATTGFDIGTLLKFSPPQYQCYSCLALMPNLNLNYAADYRTARFTCPVCEMTTRPQAPGGLQRMFEMRGRSIDVIEQSKTLARIASRFNKRGADYPPMAALYESLARATSFVHVASRGIDFQLIGALRTTAFRVPVRGFVSGVSSPNIRNELDVHVLEAPTCDLRIVEDGAFWNSPHQKLVVIDGLIAFKGAANLGTNGWRNAAQNRDHVEVVTDVDEVIDLHNRLFASVWPTTKQVPTLEAWDDIPF